VSCTACPTVTLAVAGLTVTVATGAGVTVTAAVPLFPSLVAVIVAAPAATPRTTPVALTVAIAALLLVHVIVRPASAFPLASRGVAVSGTVCPAATLAVAGLTLTVATGTVTLTVAVPLCPSLVAVIVAVPAATPVTSPLALTVATAGLPLLHVTTRPINTFPLASRGVAVSCTVWPAATLGAPGLTLTVATAAGVAVTVIAAVPLFPSLVAAIVAVPAATPVTTPLALTVALATLPLVHVIVRPVSGFPLASRGVAASGTVCPTATLADPGLTLTVATGAGVTVTATVPVFPSLVAVTVVEPAATPVITPFGLTVASAELPLDHVTVRPPSAAPVESSGVAVTWAVRPTGTLTAAGLTLTDATGTALTSTTAESARVPHLATTLKRPGELGDWYRP
jgi:hypothetical protein